MAIHRAERLGGWTIQVADSATLLPTFHTLTALHAMRWQQDDQPGVLADPDVQRFHETALPRLHHFGVLRLAVLHIAGRPAAAAHVLLSPGKILFHIGGWDPALAHASPGALLIGALLQQAAEEGRTEADFLRGAEPYKYRWGAVDRPNHHRRLTPP
jgi:CelD/BcsL family acetyltransferase involved in cellulose biosynthesis